MKESELFEPVKQYFAEQGFSVDAEVRNCDVVALRDDELIVTELKTSLNLTLLVQATQRQKITNDVYIAIPAPKKETKQWRASAQIVKRLGLGLLVVSVSPLGRWAYLKYEPDHKGRLNQRMRGAVLKEFTSRGTRLNVGGVTGTPIITAYRETALCIATMLEVAGPLPPRKVAKLCGEKTGSILLKNHYGWFERVDRGVYDISDEGKAALETYATVTERARKLIAEFDAS